MKNNEKINVKDQPEVIGNVPTGDREQIRFKRKNGQDCPGDDHSDQINGGEGNDEEVLTDLSLSVSSHRPLRPGVAPGPERHHGALRTPVTPHLYWAQTHPYLRVAPPTALRVPRVAPPFYPLPRRPRARRCPVQAPRAGESDTVAPPFPWATDRRATVHSLSHLLANGISVISGSVQCKRCERRDEISFDLRQRFMEIRRVVVENKVAMHDRAPSAWMSPTLPTCRACRHENSLKPVIAEKKKAINWLFLLLGEFLGCCTLEQLKYFCKHTKNHRTGAKDRVLYLTYLGLCKQLDPNGPFDR